MATLIADRLGEIRRKALEIQQLADGDGDEELRNELRRQLRRVFPRGGEVLTVVRPPSSGQSEVRVFSKDARAGAVEVTPAVATLLELPLAAHDEGSAIAVVATTPDPALSVVSELARVLHRRPGALRHSELDQA